MTKRQATRFFWIWLIAATTASVAGNVAHAVLSDPSSPTIAAAAAVVPVAVLLGATHGVSVLVQTRTMGGAYWAALTLTIALAGCAFVLSFGALQDLAVTWAGYPPITGWLWPLTIDLSIALSTLALLALTRQPPPRPRAETTPRKRAPAKRRKPTKTLAVQAAAV